MREREKYKKYTSLKEVQNQNHARWGTSCYGSMTQGGGKAASWERETEERSEGWIIWGEVGE